MTVRCPTNRRLGIPNRALLFTIYYTWFARRYGSISFFRQMLLNLICGKYRHAVSTTFFLLYAIDLVRCYKRTKSSEEKYHLPKEA